MTAASAVAARRTAFGAMLALLVGFIAYCVFLKANGHAWVIVESPSMGTWAPVGTLLWVAPVAFSAIKVGDVITFHPSSNPSATYSHRVVGINPDGSLATRGDINGAIDPWTVHANDIVGRVDTRWWSMGWVVKALPILIIGGVLLWALTKWFCSARWRLPARIAGAGLIVSLAIYVIKPLVRAVLLSLTLHEDGAQARIVGTGILPIRLTTSDGEQLVLREGEVGELLIRQTNADDFYSVNVGAHLPWWLIILGCLVLFAPPLYGLLIGFRPVAGDAAAVAAASAAGDAAAGGADDADDADDAAGDDAAADEPAIWEPSSGSRPD